MGPKYIHTYPSKRGTKGDLTINKKRCDHRGRIGVIYHKPRNADKHQKLEQAGADSPQDSLEVAWPSNALMLLLNFWPPEL